VTERTSPGRRVVLLAIILLAITLRPAVTATSSLLPDVVEGVPLTATEAGLLGSLPPFCFAAAGLLAPWLARHLSAERIAVLLLLVAAGAQVVRPWAPGAWAFLAVSVVVAVSTGAGNVVLPPLVKAWFPDRIPSVTALYLTFLALGASVPPLIAVPVADAVAGTTGSPGTGWRVSLALWGVVAGLAVLVWAAPAAHPRVPPMASAQRVRLPLWRSRVAWGVTILFGFQSFAAYVMFTWLPTRLVDAGLGEQRAGAMLALFAVLGLPASLVVPGLVARVRSTWVLVVGLAALFGSGLLGLAFAPASGTLGWVALSGVGSALFPVALTLVNLRTRTPATAGALSGFAQGIGYLISAAGPFAAAALHDATGRWDLPFALTAGAMVLAAAGGVLAGRGTVEDDLGRRRAAPESGPGGTSPTVTLDR
jgi:MFS transporter, CP family, cyanate transporter